MEAVDLADDGPAWLQVADGLDGKGACRNKSCRAYEQQVIGRKGMDTWSLLADIAQCPMCCNPVQPTTCGYMGCAWSFDGRKISPTGLIADVRSDWQEVSDDAYHVFSDDKENQVDGDMLVLLARPCDQKMCPICWEQNSRRSGPSEDDQYVTPCKHVSTPVASQHGKQQYPFAGCPLCRADI